MRNSNIRVRVTDHWLDAAEFAAFSPTATTANDFQQQQPLNSVAKDLEINVAYVAEQKTMANNSSKNVAFVADPADDGRSSLPSHSRLPLMYVRGGKEGGYIETHAVVAGLELSENATTPAINSPLPFLDAGGCLIIPFISPRRYHWWAGGQDLVATLDELRAPAAVVRRYTSVKEFEAWLMQGVL